MGEPAADKGTVFHETRGMKNVTVTLDEERPGGARIEAARRDLSVSSLLSELLREQMGDRKSSAAAMERYLSREARALGGGFRPSREELHDRAGLR
jgi:hypothetical protein